MTTPVTLHHRTVKIALRKNLLAEPFSLAKYRLAPYMACAHGCVYCDGRAERYHVEGDFATDITVRDNLPERLRDELTRLREKGFISLGSGITDIYQPVEEGLGLVRACAELLAEADFPVVLLTKSTLLQRDLPLWQAVQARSGCIVAVSLVFADDNLRAIFEPGAPTVGDRLNLLRQCKAAGLCTGVLAMPLLPYLADREDNLHSLFTSLADIGVDFVVPGSLTLRPGRQKEGFLKTLAVQFPEKLPSYLHLYGKDLPSGAPLAPFCHSFSRRMTVLLEKYGFAPAIPHRFFRNRMPIYDEVHILLHHMQSLYSAKGVDVTRLHLGQKLYDRWLTEEKRQFNRRRSLPAEHLDERLRAVLASGELASLLANDRLTAFINSVALERQVLDYRTLQLGGE
ncbi:MAG: hypothetical protein KJ630_01530 [Proteobacteria bacterium]|nr:hypothetical protein [Pseudomonadota bacterium]